MASFASRFLQMRCHRQVANSVRQAQLPIRAKSSPRVDIRQLNTTTDTPGGQNGPEDSIMQTGESAQPSEPAERGVTIHLKSPTEPEHPSGIKIPFGGIEHARQIPSSMSYFSREPKFNDLHVKLVDMLVRYHHLPSVIPSDAPRISWLKLDLVRLQTGEAVKAAHFAKVMRVARRLNLIEPSVRPSIVDDALKSLSQPVETMESSKKPIQLDRHGRAVGTGKRKNATARAFVVEGDGRVLINGKTLSDHFGRVHDRESAIWALTSTERLDKYNVWAVCKGGGTTGQAEALTMAIANGLVAHEPALKTALRRGKLRSALCCALMLRGFMLMTALSRLYYQRSENGGEEEAWPCQGSQSASLGQAIVVCSEQHSLGSVLSFTVSHCASEPSDSYVWPSTAWAQLHTPSPAIQ